MLTKAENTVMKGGGDLKPNRAKKRGDLLGEGDLAWYAQYTQSLFSYITPKLTVNPRYIFLSKKDKAYLYSGITIKLSNFLAEAHNVENYVVQKIKTKQAEIFCGEPGEW